MSNHWDELAEQLGLPPEPGPGSSSPSRPTTKMADQAEVVAAHDAPDVAEQPASAPRYQSVREEAPVQHGRRPRPHDFREEPEVREEIDEPGPVVSESESSPSPVMEPAAEPEEPARRGRSRRRGRGRSGRSETVAGKDGSKENDTPEEADSSPAKDEHGPRGRSRRRGGRDKKPPDEPRKSAPAAKAGHGAKGVVPASAQSQSAEPEIEDDDDVSSYSIPSWQDLIGSLYRPER